MNKIKDFVAGYFGYFLVAFFFEWLTEKITGWLFDWTPAGNPILLGVISAVFAISALSVYMDENDDSSSFALLVAIAWGIMAYGDYTDIFEPPENPTTLDMIMMFLFPTTLEGTIFDALSFIGSLGIFFKSLIKN